MIVYILLPLFNKLENNHKMFIPIITLLLWLLFTVMMSLYTSYHQIFVFTNRIPIILLGSYLARYGVLDNLSIKQYIFIMILLLVLGLFILCKFDHITCKYIYDVFYLIAIPFILGVILLINLIPTNKIINVLGSITLELYGIQMLFGFKIASMVLTIFKNKLLSNCITIIVIVLFAIIIHYLFKIIFKWCSNFINEKI